MRNFLLFLFIIIPFVSYSQFFEDFSDATLFNQNGWTGDIDHFTITSTNELQINRSGKRGVSFISAPFKMTDSLCWEFKVYLNYNPSAYNYVKVYLMSDQPNLTEALQGYYVLLGGGDDAIGLYLQDKTETESLIHASNQLKGKSNLVTIRVYYHHTEWSISVQNENKNRFEELGKKIQPIQDPVEAYYWGPVCIYTSTYSQKTFFYYFKISSLWTESLNNTDNPDSSDSESEELFPETLIPDNPESSSSLACDQVKIISSNEILLCFNKTININSAFFTLTEEELNISVSTTKYPHVLKGVIQPAMTKNQKYMILYHGIYNSQDILENNGIISFIFKDENIPPSITDDPTDPDDPIVIDPDDPNPSDNEEDEDITEPSKFGEIVFTEIMANPNGAKGLPEVEYIELTNRSTKPLNLENVLLYYGNKPIKLQNYLLKPEEYLILTLADNALFFSQDIHVMGLDNFPTLSNTGKQLYLENSKNQLLCWVEYSDKWYQSSQAKKGGISLERKDINNLNPSSSNWSESKSHKGGTPGEKNSVFEEIADIERPFLSAYYITQNNHIVLTFSKPMHPDLLISQDWIIGEDPLELICTDYPKCSQFICEFNHLPPYSLNIDKVYCISGNALYSRGTFAVNESEEIDKNDICLSEFMLWPSTDNSSFIEIQNISTKTIDLSKMYLGALLKDTTSSQLFPVSNIPVYLNSSEYAVFTTNPNQLFNHYSYSGTPQIIQLNDFPPFDPYADGLGFFDKNTTLLTGCFYNWQNHTCTINDKSNVSFEKLNCSEDSFNPYNWVSGSDLTHYSTPGYANIGDNSNPRKIKDIPETHFYLTNNYVRLEEGYPESEIILNYHFDREHVKTNIDLYSKQGYHLKRLAANEDLSLTGEFIWKNEWRSERIQFPGLYIIAVDYFHPSGLSGKEKIVIAVVP